MDLKDNHTEHRDLKGTESPPALEKADVRDGFRNPALDGFTAEDHKRIKRKIDKRLVLTLGCMYCVSLMDRTNMPNVSGEWAFPASPTRDLATLRRLASWAC